MTDVEHHALTTDTGRIGQASSQDGMAGLDESRYGTCPVCDDQMPDVVTHLATEHPEWTAPPSIFESGDPAAMRAMAAELIERADAIASAEPNSAGGVDYGVTIDDSMTMGDKVIGS